MFQQTVNRNFTTGFVGDIVRDGPLRGTVCRLMPLTGAALTSPLNDGNIIGRVYGYDQADPEVVLPSPATTKAAIVPMVQLGGANYAGVLFHPKHYALQGTTAGGTLAPSMALPDGAEVEIAEMAILVAQVFNSTTGTFTPYAGWPLAYVPNTISSTDNPNNLPFGALVCYSPAGAAPTGMIAIPGAKVKNYCSIPASSPTVQSSAVTIIQLTE